MLNRISVGWHWLEQTLNAIIEEVNVNTPLGSATITTDQSPGGTVLRIAQQNNQPPTPASGASVGGTGGSPQQPPQPPQPVVWHNVGWVQVTIVDPVSCTQSSLTVLAQKQGSSITIS